MQSRLPAALAVSAAFLAVSCTASPPPKSASTAATPVQPPAATVPASTAPASVLQTFIEPVKGTADVRVTKPVVRVVGREVVTTMKVKNLSAAPIAGLRVDEYWFDKSGNVVAGDRQRLMKPLQPNEIAVLELRSPKDPKMYSNTYQFSHANGKVHTDIVPKL